MDGENFPAGDFRSVRSPTVLYFVLAYAITWSLLVPVLVSPDPAGDPVLVILYLLGGFGPSVAAVVVTWRECGRSGVRSLMAKLTRWRVGARWYVAALSIPILLKGASLGVLVALGNPVPEFSVSSPAVLLVTAVVVGLFPGAVGEELGWRGYALPKLQERWSALVASLVLGLVWALWHLPTFCFAGGLVAQSAGPVVWFGIEITALSVIFSWIVNNADGSVLLAIVLHAANNGTTPVLYGAIQDAGYGDAYGQVLAVASIVVAGLVVAIAGPEHLSRRGTRTTTV